MALTFMPHSVFGHTCEGSLQDFSLSFKRQGQHVPVQHRSSCFTSHTPQSFEFSLVLLLLNGPDKLFRLTSNCTLRILRETVVQQLQCKVGRVQLHRVQMERANYPDNKLKWSVLRSLVLSETELTVCYRSCCLDDRQLDSIQNTTSKTTQ